MCLDAELAAFCVLVNRYQVLDFAAASQCRDRVD